MLWALTFLPLLLTRQIAVTVVDQEKAEQGLGRMTGFCLQSALPRLFSFLLKQWNPSAASHKNCKKANSRWRWMWNGPLDRAATGRIMQPFRLSLPGAPFVPTDDMLLHWGSWKGPFCSICLKAADLCDNLKTLDVKFSLTHRLLNGFSVLSCDVSPILTWSYKKEVIWKLQRGHPWRDSSQVTGALWRGPDDFHSVERARTRGVDKVGLGSQLVPANVSISTRGICIIQQRWLTGPTPQVSQWLLSLVHKHSFRSLKLLPGWRY